MDKIKKLESEIIKHKSLYYAGKAIISDEDYDKLESELKLLDPENKVLNIVGTSVVNNKVRHDKKMLSLNKTYKLDELLTWKNKSELLSTFKIDGSSCSLIYTNGSLLLGKTRGDGEFGENITEKILNISSIPKVISINGKIEVRGEVYIDESNFIKLCEKMVSLNLEKPTSQRNIVAGILGRKENIELAKYLQFQAFEIISEEKFKRESEKLELLKVNKFMIPDYKILIENKEIEEVINSAKEFMAEGEYLIDGLVFTYNQCEFHEELGYTAHHPKYKMAFKFQGETKIAKIISITWQVSRNGVLTPVAEIEPVELSGAKISRVTLHNLGLVKEFELKSGDEIEIVRSGEVIPKFLEIKKSSNDKFFYPEQCPSCSKKLEIQDIRLICNNSNCPEKIIEEINYFIQKIGIEDLSRKRLAIFIKEGLISRIPELYKIKKEQLLNIDKIKEKMAQKLITNIEQSKNADLITFMTALGISGGGKNKCEKIVSSGYNEINQILNLGKEKLIDIEGFAEKSANDFIESLNSKKKLIQDLLEVGFNPQNNNEITSSKITGLKFCITGTLSRKRNEVEDDVKKNGGIIVTSVTKNTDYLVTNDKESSSSKFKKALQLKIPIITEEMLLGMIHGEKS